MLNEAAMAAEELSASIEQLLQSPDMDALQAAQADWHNAAAAYEKFYLFTRLGLAAPLVFKPLLNHHNPIAAWPILPGYLDSFGAHAMSGLVFDVTVPINSNTVRAQHGLTDSEEVALGLYALEYLLFGENNQRGPLVFQAITQLSDQYKESGFENVNELPRNRRRALMKLQAQMITNDLSLLRSLWDSKGPNTLAAHFTGLDPHRQVHLITRAALTMVTEQIMAVSQQAQPDNRTLETQFWHSQQTAERLLYQLIGWQSVLAEVDHHPNAEELKGATKDAIIAITAIKELPPVATDNHSLKADWQQVYQALSSLARQL